MSGNFLVAFYPYESTMSYLYIEARTHVAMHFIVHSAHVILHKLRGYFSVNRIIEIHTT